MGTIHRFVLYCVQGVESDGVRAKALCAADGEICPHGFEVAESKVMRKQNLQEQIDWKGCQGRRDVSPTIPHSLLSLLHVRRWRCIRLAAVFRRMTSETCWWYVPACADMFEDIPASHLPGSDNELTDAGGETG